MSERMNVGGGEDRKMKRKLEEVEKEDHHHHEREEEHFLSLRICNNADMSKPLKVSKPTAGSGFGENNNKKPPAEGKRTKEFGCKYCMKKFKSSQALGGHQNAHRRERVIWKMEKELSTFGHPHFCPCSSIITNNNLPIPISRTASSSTFNPHFHLHGFGTHHPHHHHSHSHSHSHSHVPNWAHGSAHHHQGQPKPGLSFGMMNTSGNLNVEEKKPDVSTSGLDLSLRL